MFWAQLKPRPLLPLQLMLFPPSSCGERFELWCPFGVKRQEFWVATDELLNLCRILSWEINLVEFGEINAEKELLAGDFIHFQGYIRMNSLCQRKPERNFMDVVSLFSF